MHLNPGTIIADEYKLIRLIASDTRNATTIWSADSEQIGTSFALKFHANPHHYRHELEIGKELRSSPSDLRKRITFNSIMSAVKAFPKVENAIESEQGDAWYPQQLMVMQLGDRTLRDFACSPVDAQRPISALDIRIIVTDVVNGLSVLQEYGLVHCDLRPDIIMRYDDLPSSDWQTGQLENAHAGSKGQFGSGRGGWKIAGFEHVRHVNDKLDDLPEPRFAAPECKNKVADFPLDLFALGRLIELLAIDETLDSLVKLESSGDSMFLDYARSEHTTIHHALVIKVVKELLAVNPKSRMTLKELKESGFMAITATGGRQALNVEVAQSVRKMPLHRRTLDPMKETSHDDDEEPIVITEDPEDEHFFSESPLPSERMLQTPPSEMTLENERPLIRVESVHSEELNRADRKSGIKRFLSTPLFVRSCG